MNDSLQCSYKTNSNCMPVLPLCTMQSLKSKGFAILDKLDQEAKLQEARVTMSLIVSGMQKLHILVPISTNIVEVRRFFNSKDRYSGNYQLPSVCCHQ